MALKVKLQKPHATIHRVEALLWKGLGRLKKGFTKHAYARTADRFSVRSDHKDAVRWCPLGGIGEDVTDTATMETAKQLLNDLCGKGVHDWADDKYRKRKEVVALFNRAIKEAHTRGI